MEIKVLKCSTLSKSGKHINPDLKKKYIYNLNQATVIKIR